MQNQCIRRRKAGKCRICGRVLKRADRTHKWKEFIFEGEKESSFICNSHVVSASCHEIVLSNEYIMVNG